MKLFLSALLLFFFYFFFKKMCIAVFVAGLYSIFEVRALKTHHTAPINTE